MKRKLLICSVFAASCIAVLLCREQLAALLAPASGVRSDFVAVDAELESATDAMSPPDDPTRLLLQASQKLKAWPPLEARVEHKVNLFGQQLAGPGRYVQAGQGSQKSRLELTFQSEGFESHIVQVNDGRFLYITNDAEKETPRQRIDLAALEGPDGNGDASIKTKGGVSQWMAMGGLSYLMQQLAEDFDFGTSSPATLGSRELLEFTGKWKSERIASICSDLKVVDDKGKLLTETLPPQFPTHVRVALASDEPLALFPHRITYLRETRDGNKVEIASFEFYDVCPAKNLTAATFQVEKDAARLSDITDSVQKNAQGALRLR